MTRSNANLLLVICAVLWGSAFLFQKSAMAHIGPMTFVAARTSLAALLLLPLAIMELRRSTAPPGGKFYAFGVLAAAVFLGASLLQQYGVVTASVTNAGFLTALYVVATPFISFALTGRAIAPTIWFATALSFAGTWLLGAGTLGGFGRGDILVAASAVVWALHIVILALAAPRGYPVLFTALQFAIVGVLCAAGAMVCETATTEQLLAAAPEIIYVGALSTALSFTVLAFALRYAGPAEAAIIISSETLFAAFLAWMFFGEQLTAIGMAGAASILAGVLIVQYTPTRSRVAAVSASSHG
jgi:drug/metabolite transporter (DMT)-like permease